MAEHRDELNIGRFLEAQAGGIYEQALAELRAGCKQGHWIWFVFPQVRGLGFSWAVDYYGIGSWEEAEAYLADEVLRSRLREAARALLDLPGDDPEAVLGPIDALKVRSSCTLFELVSDAPEFPAVLNRHYAGECDPLTLEIVKGFPTHNVLFLDFDGVMQPDYDKSHEMPLDEFCALRTWAAENYEDEGFLHVGNDDIAAALRDWTNEAVEGARRIAEEGDARIAISSSWRFYDEDDNLRCLLKLRGLDGHFAGALSRSHSLEREDAIRLYLAQHPCSVRNYVAVDDAKLIGLDGHFVRIRKGSIREENAEKALLVLNGEGYCEYEGDDEGDEEEGFWELDPVVASSIEWRM